MFRKKFLVFSILFLVLSCAKRGYITGGEKDKTPPKIVSSVPKNGTTDFNKKEIKIVFDEYIKVKDIQKQLITSPPMKNPLTIIPQGTASKFISIKINDTLQPNTTYSFNFGQSVADYNEGNPYPQLKYVFSTGKYVDSLSIEGIIKDSYEKETAPFVNVMLYEVNEKFKDSTIYKETPRYITNTLDSLKTFKIENIKAGKYKLVALKQTTNNYKYNPNKDKIGFYNQTISIPDKSIFEIELFKEKLAFKTKKPYQASGNRIIMGYDGDSKNLKIVTKHKSELLKSRFTKLADKDSVQVWIPTMKNDSIQLFAENDSYKKDYVVKIRNQRQDTLKIFVNEKTMKLNENFRISASIPLEKFDSSKMKLIKKDSSEVKFKTKYVDFNQNLELIFDPEPNSNYIFSMLPNAVEDYLGQKNDSMKIAFSTKSQADYGTLKVNLQNAKSFPVLVELTNLKGKTIATAYAEKNATVDFLFIEPDKYFLRAIYDLNKNKERDSGNFLKNIQPEETIHFPKEIEIRPNWDIDQAFDLSLKPPKIEKKIEKIIPKK
jgi:Bacterial Ig-like domain